MKYPSLKWQWIFVLIITCSCFPFITNKTFIGLESVTRQLSIPGITYSSRAAVNTRNYLLFTSSCQYQELLTLHEQLSIPGLTYTSRAAVNTRNYLHFTSSYQYQELLTLHEQLSIPGITYTSRAAVNTRNYLHFTSSCQYQELLVLHEHLDSAQIFYGIGVAHLFSFRCCDFFYFAVFILYLVSNVASVSDFSILACPFGFF
jgi:hypothetical protein